MQDIVDLDRYPLDRPGAPAWTALVETARTRLARDGLVNLPGFLVEAARTADVARLVPVLDRAAFVHARRHNVYFEPVDEGLPEGHPARILFETSNRTICADQMGDAAILRLYDWPAFAAFLAAVMEKPALFPMDDPLARVNVMAYGAGQALNWHFDRSEFTTTLLLQAPEAGGAFEYVRDLQSAEDPNHAGVTEVLEGRRAPDRSDLAPGTLNIFCGRDTMHRVTEVAGRRDRIVAVFSFFDRAGVRFTAAERLGFYGRAA